MTRIAVARGANRASIVVICTWLLAALAPSTTLADAGPKLPRQHIFLHPGLTLGGAKTLGAGTGFVLGGEVSAGLWLQPFYIGGVVEGLYDWQRTAPRVMVGVVAGLGPFGADGGYLAEVADGRTAHGGAVRLFLTLGFMGFYVRYGALRDAPDFVDFGLFIKAPLRFRAVYPERPRWREPPSLPSTPASPGEPPPGRPDPPPASGPVEPR